MSCIQIAASVQHPEFNMGFPAQAPTKPLEEVCLCPKSLDIMRTFTQQIITYQAISTDLVIPQIPQTARTDLIVEQNVQKVTKKKKITRKPARRRRKMASKVLPKICASILAFVCMHVCAYVCIFFHAQNCQRQHAHAQPQCALPCFRFYRRCISWR